MKVNRAGSASASARRRPLVPSKWCRDVGNRSFISRTQHAQETGRDLRAGRLLVAAHEQVRGRRRADVVERLELAEPAPARFGGADPGSQVRGRRFLSGAQGGGDLFGLDRERGGKPGCQVFLDLGALRRGGVDRRGGVGADGFGERLELRFEQAVGARFMDRGELAGKSCTTRSIAAFSRSSAASSAGERSGKPRSLFFVSVGTTGSHRSGLYAGVKMAINR